MIHKKTLVLILINLSLFILTYFFVTLPTFEIRTPIIDNKIDDNILIVISIGLSLLAFVSGKKIRSFFSSYFIFFWLVTYSYYQLSIIPISNTDKWQTVGFLNKEWKDGLFKLNVSTLNNSAQQQLSATPEFNITTRTISVLISKGYFGHKLLSGTPRIEENNSCEKKFVTDDFLSLGYSYSRERCFSKAIKFYKKAILKEPISQFAYRELGNCFLATKDYKNAFYCFSIYKDLQEFNFIEIKDFQLKKKEENELLNIIETNNFSEMKDYISNLSYSKNQIFDKKLIFLISYSKSKK